MLESMSTIFQRKYNVDIKAMFENGCPSYPSLLKPPFRKKELSELSRILEFRKLNSKWLPFPSLQILVVDH